MDDSPAWGNVDTISSGHSVSDREQSHEGLSPQHNNNNIGNSVREGMEDLANTGSSLLEFDQGKMNNTELAACLSPSAACLVVSNNVFSYISYT